MAFSSPKGFFKNLLKTIDAVVQNEILLLSQVTNMSILNTVRLRSVRRVRLLSRYHPDEAEAEAVFGAILQHRAITQVSTVQYTTVQCSTVQLSPRSAHVF